MSDPENLDELLKTYLRYTSIKSAGNFIADRVFPTKATRQQERLNELQIKQMERALDYPEDSFDLAESFRKKTGYPLSGVVAAGVGAVNATRMFPRSRSENLAPFKARDTMTPRNPFWKNLTKADDAFNAFKAFKSGVNHVRPARLLGKLWK